MLATTARADSNSMQVHSLWNKQILQANTIRLRYGGKAGVSNIQSQSLVDLDIANKRW